MLNQENLQKLREFEKLDLLANQIVEGFISGIHKSPFHGYSAEFAEHKIYNKGENTKNIDWKLYARTDKLFVKRFEEETNLRCHIIIDNSSSMHYPKLDSQEPFYKSKIGFAVLAGLVLMNLLKKQRDAYGLSVFSDTYEYYAPEKTNNRHYQMLLSKLGQILSVDREQKQTYTVDFLHQIAEKIHKRSMIVLFTDMFLTQDEDKLFAALQHLKHNKHKVVVFHTYSKRYEMDFDFANKPKKYVDLETGESINLYSSAVKEQYQDEVKKYFEKIALICSQYKIAYVPVNVEDNFDVILNTYLLEQKKFK
ncbi:MAG: DUF58 domain-containing protein [Bacteroidota bacterium]|nr:DUF58 domain-containing protein [Bacteroidota bacterium]